MSTVSIIVMVVLAYIMQVLLSLAYPYYKYRQSYKSHQQRTIGGFVKFTSATMGGMYLFLAFLPFFGLALILYILILGLIIVGIGAFYNKFIKDIKI